MAERVNLEGLRYAHAVAETKSFSAAARAYGVTQPALSNGIAKLEERLGDRLFDRSPRGVTQTAFGARILPLIKQALVALDAVTVEARRLTEPGARKIRMGLSPLISSSLVTRAFSMVRELPVPRDLVLREADMQELRDGLQAVARHHPDPRRARDAALRAPGHRCRTGRRHHPRPRRDRPLELEEAGAEQFILVPDTCGLTTFTAQLFQAHEMPLRAYPGEAASYQVLEDWTRLGLGSAMVPRSKLTSPDVPHRHLTDQGREVQISFEAVWSSESALGADLVRLADGLTAARR